MILTPDLGQFLAFLIKTDKLDRYECFPLKLPHQNWTQKVPQGALFGVKSADSIMDMIKIPYLTFVLKVQKKSYRPSDPNLIFT